MIGDRAMPSRETLFRLPGKQEELVAIPNRSIDASILADGDGLLTNAPLYQRAVMELLAEERWASRRIFVTSPREGDGKTRTAFHLAAAMADSGKSVLLAEINFARPRFRAALGNLRFRYGIDCATRGVATPEESVFSVYPSGLHIAAVRKPTPVERMERCLLHLNDYFDWASEHYELLILDCPSVLSPEWGRWFHAFVGQALLVVREDRTPVADIRESVRLLSSHLTGAWFNRDQSNSVSLQHSRPVRAMETAADTPHRSFESLRVLSTLLAHASGAAEEDVRNPY